jgi:uncharacterized membrane protein SirB2
VLAIGPVSLFQAKIWLFFTKKSGFFKKLKFCFPRVTSTNFAFFGGVKFRQIFYLKKNEQTKWLGLAVLFFWRDFTVF